MDNLFNAKKYINTAMHSVKHIDVLIQKDLGNARPSVP